MTDSVEGEPKPRWRPTNEGRPGSGQTAVTNDAADTGSGPIGLSGSDALIGSARAQAHAEHEAATLDARVGPFYDTAALLETLRVSRDTLDALVRAGDVLKVMSSDGYPFFPSFQFGQDAQPLPQLREVLLELDPEQVDPWGDAVWLNAPAEELEDLSPTTALRLGRTEDVVRLARAAGSFRLG